MKYRVFALVLVVALALGTLPCGALEVVPATDRDFDLPCEAAILMDEDSGTVLYEKNADQQRPIASITKVMTLLLTFEALEAGKISLDDIVPVSEHAYHMGGSQIWLEPGEQLTLNEMLKAICISSANDAAVAVAEYVGGSEPVFVEHMNARAKELGMENTTFRNACGLDEDGHLSSARDVAIMSREMLLHHPEVEDYCTVWMD
ncbi:D-alanyl-D-alanine carboxypeptidase, partial [bacterium]|nr:D-alanyl-D-alanine carboxypeptidase [bacterium]